MCHRVPFYATPHVVARAARKVYSATYPVLEQTGTADAEGIARIDDTYKSTSLREYLYLFNFVQKINFRRREWDYEEIKK